MERDLSVNGVPETEDPAGGFDFPPASHPARTDLGPCLYLGPRGQRCSRRATKAGFCAIHQPGAAIGGIAKPSKKLLASLLAIVAVIWPYLADIVREVIRWIHAH